MKHGSRGDVPEPTDRTAASQPRVASPDGYRLTPVRRAREQAEVVRRAELGTAMSDARLAQHAAAASRSRTAAAREKLASAVSAREHLTIATAEQLGWHERFIARCRGLVAAMTRAELRANAALDSSAEAVDHARATLARARAEREIIERHFARWREAQLKLADRRED